MSEPIDRELQDWLAQGAAEADQTAAALREEMATTAKWLGELRKALLIEGFTPQGAEDLVREYYGEFLNRMRELPDE